MINTKKIPHPPAEKILSSLKKMWHYVHVICGYHCCSDFPAFTYTVCFLFSQKRRTIHIASTEASRPTNKPASTSVG